MQCAITAAERGHDVLLCEKSDALGGALKAEQGISFKKDLFGFIGTKALQMEMAGVKVRLNTEVTDELVREISPDVLVVAVGSDPLIPPIPGIDNAKVVMADDLPKASERLGQNIVILGGGLVGGETGVHLAKTGKTVTVVEMKDDVCTDANPRHRPILMAELKKHVTCLTNTRAVSISDEGLVCETADGSSKLISADNIICAAGRKARRDVAESLRDSAPYVTEIGDCVRPANVTVAVFRGFFAALDI